MHYISILPFLTPIPRKSDEISFNFGPPAKGPVPAIARVWAAPRKTPFNAIKSVGTHADTSGKTSESSMLAELVKSLRFNVNLKSAKGETPLLLACENSLDDAAPVTALIASGANVNEAVSSIDTLAPTYLFFNTCSCAGFRWLDATARSTLSAKIRDCKCAFVTWRKHQRTRPTRHHTRHGIRLSIEEGRRGGQSHVCTSVVVRCRCYNHGQSTWSNHRSNTAVSDTNNTPVHGSLVAALRKLPTLHAA